MKKYNSPVHKNKRRVVVPKDPRITKTVPLCKLFHNSINLLRLTRKAELVEKATKSINKINFCKII